MFIYSAKKYIIASKEEIMMKLFDTLAGKKRELKPLAAIEGHVDGLFGTRESHEGTMYVVSGPAGGILTVNLDAPLSTSFERGPAGVMVDFQEWRKSH